MPKFLDENGLSIVVKDYNDKIDDVKPIKFVEDESSIPNDVDGLYRFIETESGVTQSSHIYENVREDHGAEETEFYKTTTTNNASLTTATFMAQFDATLSNFIECSNIDKGYALYYAPKEGGDLDEPFSGIRFGTSSAIGTLTVILAEQGSITFRKYFSYNASTGEILAYDAESKVVVDGDDEFEFDTDDGPMTITLGAGTHTISSFDGDSAGRVVLIGFEFEGQPYSIYKKKKLARAEEVEAVDTKFEQFKTNTQNKFATDEQQINANKTDIVTINSKMGDVQIFNRYARLPNPSVEYLDKILRKDGALYQCVQVGNGVIKDWSFENVMGTSEITSSNAASFYGDVGNQFGDYIEIDETSKFYRNNGSVKLGSSSSTGYVKFNVKEDVELPITKLSFGVRAYNSNGSTLDYYITLYNEEDDLLDEISGTRFISNPTETTVIDLTSQLLDGYKVISMYFESNASHEETPEEGEQVTVQNDKRLVMTGLTCEFGTVEYEWQNVGANAIEIADLTQIN